MSQRLDGAVDPVPVLPGGGAARRAARRGGGAAQRAAAPAQAEAALQPGAGGGAAGVGGLRFWQGGACGGGGGGKQGVLELVSWWWHVGCPAPAVGAPGLLPVASATVTASVARRPTRAASWYTRISPARGSSSRRGGQSGGQSTPTGEHLEGGGAAGTCSNSAWQQGLQVRAGCPPAAHLLMCRVPATPQTPSSGRSRTATPQCPAGHHGSGRQLGHAPPFPPPPPPRNLP